MAEQQTFREGDRVSWGSHGGRAHGVILGKLTERTTVDGHTAAASPDEPQYRIRSDDSGREVAHRPEVLRREQG